MQNGRTPVVFIHGLWLHSRSWRPWEDLFRQAGYEPTAPEWPGTPDTVAAARAAESGIGGYGTTAVADHFAEIIRGLPAPPIVIGHSFGGLLAQNLLGRGLAAAAIAIDPAPIRGVLPLPLSAVRVASVVLRNPANWKRAVSLTPAQFRYGFGNELSEQESAELYERWTIPSPGRPVFEAALANVSPASPTKVDTANATRGPLLLLAGEKDHTVPPLLIRATLKQYRKSSAVTELKELPGRCHSLTIDSRWREVADLSLEWLKQRSL